MNDYMPEHLDNASVEGATPWLTPENRQKIYSIAAAIMAILTTINVITIDDQDLIIQILDNVWNIATIAALFIARMHVRGTATNG